MHPVELFFLANAWYNAWYNVTVKWLEALKVLRRLLCGSDVRKVTLFLPVSVTFLCTLHFT